MLLRQKCRKQRSAAQSCKEVFVFQGKEKYVNEREIKFIVYDPCGKFLTRALFPKGKEPLYLAEGLLSVSWLGAASE